MFSLLLMLSASYVQFYKGILQSVTVKWLVKLRELIPPITAFLEEDLKLVRPGCNLTPANGVGSRRLFRTPTQKLLVVKPPCYLPTHVT